jgi:phosphopantothenoylcysteine decarboxylase/phosphopantothenate--cysteine ligase
LETDNESDNAKSKLARKNLDFIVLNSLNDEGAGFGTGTNKITILEKSGKVTPYPLADKKVVASYIADKMEEYLK